jgi:hypothetical protein
MFDPPLCPYNLFAPIFLVLDPSSFVYVKACLEKLTYFVLHDANYVNQISCLQMNEVFFPLYLGSRVVKKGPFLLHLWVVVSFLSIS